MVASWSWLGYSAFCLSLKVKRTSIAFKSCLGLVEDTGGSWFGFRLFIIFFTQSIMFYPLTDYYLIFDWKDYSHPKCNLPLHQICKVQSLLVHPESNTIWHRLFPFLTPVTHQFGNYVGYVCAVVPLATVKYSSKNIKFTQMKNIFMNTLIWGTKKGMIPILITFTKHF